MPPASPGELTEKTLALLSPGACCLFMSTQGSHVYHLIPSLCSLHDLWYKWLHCELWMSISDLDRPYSKTLWLMFLVCEWCPNKTDTGECGSVVFTKSEECSELFNGQRARKWWTLWCEIVCVEVAHYIRGTDQFLSMFNTSFCLLLNIRGWTQDFFHLERYLWFI